MVIEIKSWFYINLLTQNTADCADKSRAFTPSIPNPTALMEPSDQPMPPSSSLKSIVTPIRAPRLLDYLTCYDSNQVHFLVFGFSKGFRIPFRGQRQFRFTFRLLKINNTFSWTELMKKFYLAGWWDLFSTHLSKIFKYLLWDWFLKRNLGNSDLSTIYPTQMDHQLMMAYHMNSVQCSTSPFMMLY